MKNVTITTNKAYLVKVWCKEVKEGYAFETTIYDWGETKVTMFTTDGLVWQIIKSHSDDKIYYDLNEAENAAKDEIKKAIDFYSKESEKYKQKALDYQK